MAGHSKWANIKHKKAAEDARRGRIWTRLIREITVAARLGGGDIAANPRLRLAVDRATEVNMPKDNMQRAIARGTGTLDGANYEEVRYEGYGPAGAAVIIDCLTDNRTRTAADIRHAFSKHGGNLGQDGCVVFMFTHCGQLLFAPDTVEDALIEAALAAGADDVSKQADGSFELVCAPGDLTQVRQTLEAAGFIAEHAELTMKPHNEITLTGEDATMMHKLLDALENLDDVQQIFTNTNL